MQALLIQSHINTTVIQTQTVDSDESQVDIHEFKNQQQQNKNFKKGCNHKDLIYFYVESSRSSESSQFQKAIQKKNCISCGVFISKHGIPTVKESYCEYEMDVSPQENLAMLMEDELMNSNHQFYSQFVANLTDAQIKRINEIRKPFIARIYDFGDQLRQSNQTVQLACFYFDFIYLKQLQHQFKINSSSLLNPEESQGIFDQDLQYLDQKKGQEYFKMLNLKCQMCLLLASKFDELDDYIPMIRDFQKLARYEFQYQQCKQYEDTVLRELDWKLNIITPYHILDSLIAQGVIFEDDKFPGQTFSDNAFDDESLRQIRKKAEYFCRLSVESGFNFQASSPSIVAFSCVLASRLANQVIPWWNQKFEELSTMSIFTNAGLREYLQTLYKVYDPTYNFQILIPKKPLARSSIQKSMISTRAANTLENTHINGVILNSEASNSSKTGRSNPFKVLEPNQNLLNDSLIGAPGQMNQQQSLKSFKLEEKSQALSSERQIYLTCKDNGMGSHKMNLEEEFQQLDEIENSMEDIAANYEIDLTVDEESFILTKKSIDKLPESHISNRQSHLAFQMSGTMSSMANLQKCNQINSKENDYKKSEKPQRKGDKENQVQISADDSARESMSIANEEVAQSQKQRVQASKQKAFILPRCPQITQKPRQKLTTNRQNVLNKVKRQELNVSSLERVHPAQAYDAKKYRSNCSSQIRSDTKTKSNVCSTQKQSNIKEKSSLKIIHKEQAKNLKIKVNNEVKSSNCSINVAPAIRCSSQQQIIIHSDKEALNLQPGCLKSSRNSTVHEMSELYDSKERPLPSLNFAEDKIEQLRLKYQTQNPIQEKLKTKKIENKGQSYQLDSSNQSKAVGKALSRNTNINQLSSSNIQGTSFATLSQTKLNCQTKKNEPRERSLSEKGPSQQNEMHTFKSKLFEILQSEEFKHKIQIPSLEKQAPSQNEQLKKRKSNKQSFSLENVNHDLKKRKLSETHQKMMDIYKKSAVKQCDLSKQLANGNESRHQLRAKIASIDLCNSVHATINSNTKMQNVQSQKHINYPFKFESTKAYGSLERTQDFDKPLRSQRVLKTSSSGIQSARESYNPIKDRQSLQQNSKIKQQTSQLNQKRFSDNCAFQPKPKICQYNQSKVNNKIIHSSISHEKIKLYMSSQNAQDLQASKSKLEERYSNQGYKIQSQRHDLKSQKQQLPPSSKVPLSARSGLASSREIATDCLSQSQTQLMLKSKADLPKRNQDQEEFKTFSQRIKSVALVNSPIKQDQPYQILITSPNMTLVGGQIKSSTNLQALDQLRKYCTSNPLNQTHNHQMTHQSLNTYLGRITGY